VKNDDKQFWKENFHAANRKAQHAFVNGPVFFFERERGIFLFFSLIPNVFPSSSQKFLKVFPNAFPKRFPIAPGFYSVWFAPSLTPTYQEVKRSNLGEHICLYFATGVQRGTVQPIKCDYNLYQLHA